MCVCQKHRVLASTTGTLRTSASVKVIAVDVRATVKSLPADATTPHQLGSPIPRRRACERQCAFRFITSVTNMIRWPSASMSRSSLLACARLAMSGRCPSNDHVLYLPGCSCQRSHLSQCQSVVILSELSFENHRKHPHRQHREVTSCVLYSRNQILGFHKCSCCVFHV